MNTFIQFMKTTNVMSVLDIGSGPGLYSMRIKKLNPQADITTVDFSPAMVSLCHEKGFTSLMIDASQAFTLRKKFDLIIAMGVFEFIKDGNTMMENIRNHMHESSRACILVPKYSVLNIIYLFYHSLLGNQIYLRRRSYYRKFFANFDLRCIDVTSASIISDLLIFEKAS